MTNSKLDNFFDAMDSVADKVVGVMEKTHHPDKEDVEDAEVVATYGAEGKVFASVPGPDGRSVYYHVFNAQATDAPTLCGVVLPHRSILHLSSSGFLGNVCIACLRSLIAPQAQSPQKELPGVR